MATKKTETKKELSEMTYAELEKEAEETLTKLSDTSLPLDETAKLYEYGKKVSAEMEKRLAELEKSVTDTKAQ